MPLNLELGYQNGLDPNVGFSMGSLISRVANIFTEDLQPRCFLKVIHTQYKYYMDTGARGSSLLCVKYCVIIKGHLVIHPACLPNVVR
jgi:hypothetical protein